MKGGVRMKSVKGMSLRGLTWGTPEFIEKAKAAEIEGEARYEVNRRLEELEEMEMPDEVRQETKDYAATIFELCGGECEWV